MQVKNPIMFGFTSRMSHAYECCLHGTWYECTQLLSVSYGTICESCANGVNHSTNLHMIDLRLRELQRLL